MEVGNVDNLSHDSDEGHLELPDALVVKMSAPGRFPATWRPAGSQRWRSRRQRSSAALWSVEPDLDRPCRSPPRTF